MLGFVGTQSEGICLVDGVDLVFNIREPTKYLLITIRMVAHSYFFPFFLIFRVATNRLISLLPRPRTLPMS